MKQFKDILIDVGIGSFLSLLSVTLNHATLSMPQFGLLMTMSAIMGLLSIVFRYDQITFLTQFISHFILEMLTYGFFIWLTFGELKIVLSNVPTFIIIYIIIFIYIRQQARANARRINEQLKKKKSQS